MISSGFTMDIPVRPPTTSMRMVLSGFFRFTWRCMFVAAAWIMSVVLVVVNLFSTVILKVSFSVIFGASSVTACFISFRSVWTTFSMGMTLRV